MGRSLLRNKFLKTRSNEDKKLCNTQRNYCLTLVRKAKKYYYNNLDHENVTDNDSDIPTKVIKSNSDIFTDALYSEYNRSLETSVFHHQ